MDGGEEQHALSTGMTTIMNSTTSNTMMEHTRALRIAKNAPIRAEQPNMSKNFPIDFNNTIPVPSSVT